MQQDSECKKSAQCPLLKEALSHIGAIELEKARLQQQIDYILFDNKFYQKTIAQPLYDAAYISRQEKLKSDIKDICCTHLKYRATAAGYEPTIATKVLNKILKILEDDKKNEREIYHEHQHPTTKRIGEQNHRQGK